MKVLVCGGREFTNREFLCRTLSDLNERHGFDALIHGGARGADSLAGDWATINRIRVEVFPADWSLGRKAGPIRNQRMLDEGKPDLVVAFPGGRGTADMVQRAMSAGLRVVTVAPPLPPHSTSSGTRHEH